jgi:hypothetical protein
LNAKLTHTNTLIHSYTHMLAQTWARMVKCEQECLVPHRSLLGVGVNLRFERFLAQSHLCVCVRVYLSIRECTHTDFTHKFIVC